MGLPEDLVATFRWVGGHADHSRWFADPTMFQRVVEALSDPFTEQGVSEVVAIEARGFLLAGAIARELGAGVVPIRKRGAIVAGPTIARFTPPDYRGRSTELLLQRTSLSAASRVLLVDDWLETGSQLLTAVSMVEQAGAELAGAAVVVDQSPAGLTDRLPRFHSIVHADLLGPSEGLDE